MKFRTLLAGAGFCVLAVVSLEAVDRYVFGRAVETIVSRVDGLTFERIVDEPWRGDARIVGIEWRRGHTRMRIGALTFEASTLLPPVAAAIAGTGSASAENITIEAGSSTYKIKRIELTGASISSAEILQIFDRNAAQPLAGRLAQLSATTIAIPELTIENKTETGTQTFIYHDITFSGVIDGKAASASAAGASLSFSAANVRDVQGAYGQISAKDVDLVLGARILTETRDQPEAPKLPLYNSMAVDGFHLGNAHFGLDVKSFSVAAVKGRPPLKLPVETGVDKPTAKDSVKGDALRFLDSFEINNMVANDIVVDVNKDAHPAKFTMARATISRLDGSRIEAVEGQDLAFDRAQGRIAAESVSFRGLDFTPLATVDSASNRPATDFQPDFAEIILTRLSADMTGAADEPKKPDASFKVERFEVKSSRPQDAATANLEFALDHFTYPLSDAGAFPNLAAMGYSTLDLTSRLSTVWTRASSELAIDDFSVEGAGMGSLKITALVGNVTPDLASSDSEAAAAAARNLLVKKLDVHLENTGLFDKSLAVQAKNQNKTVDEMRQSDLMTATFIIPSLLGNEPSARLLGSELAKFISDPKNFSLVALSPEGFGVADLELVKTPRALLKKIEISASAND